MYWGVSYVLYTCDLYHNFGLTPTVEKFNPSANFFTIQTLRLSVPCGLLALNSKTECSNEAKSGVKL